VLTCGFLGCALVAFSAADDSFAFGRGVTFVGVVTVTVDDLGSGVEELTLTTPFEPEDSRSSRSTSSANAWGMADVASKAADSAKDAATAKGLRASSSSLACALTIATPLWRVAARGAHLVKAIVERPEPIGFAA